MVNVHVLLGGKNLGVPSRAWQLQRTSISGWIDEWMGWGVDGQDGGPRHYVGNESQGLGKGKVHLSTASLGSAATFYVTEAAP